MSIFLYVKKTLLIFLYEVQMSTSFLQNRIIHLLYTFLYHSVVLWVATPMLWKKILHQTSGSSDINTEDRGRMFLRKDPILQKHYTVPEPRMPHSEISPTSKPDTTDMYVLVLGLFYNAVSCTNERNFTQS